MLRFVRRDRPGAALDVAARAWDEIRGEVGSRMRPSGFDSMRSTVTPSLIYRGTRRAGSNPTTRAPTTAGTVCWRSPPRTGPSERGSCTTRAASASDRSVSISSPQPRRPLRSISICANLRSPPRPRRSSIINPRGKSRARDGPSGSTPDGPAGPWEPGHPPLVAQWCRRVGYFRPASQPSRRHRSASLRYSSTRRLWPSRS